MGLRRIIAGLLAMLAVAVSASAGQQRSIESDQETLISLERDWNEAFYQKKVDVIEKLLADEFMATYDDGSRGDKARELKLTRDFDQRVESAIQEAFVVKVYGNTGVVWFTLHLVGIKQGQRSELDLSYTDIWVLRAGRWLCVSSQSTRVNPKQPVQYNLDGKVFRPVSNTGTGEVDASTRFHYRQSGDVVTATYGGGSIVTGHLLARVLPDGELDMRYHHINTRGELMLGTCRSTPERLPDGRLRFSESWQWLCGDMSSGRSAIEEV